MSTRSIAPLVRQLSGSDNKTLVHPIFPVSPNIYSLSNRLTFLCWTSIREPETSHSFQIGWPAHRTAHIFRNVQGIRLCIPCRSTFLVIFRRYLHCPKREYWKYTFDSFSTGRRVGNPTLNSNPLQRPFVLLPIRSPRLYLLEYLDGARQLPLKRKKDIGVHWRFDATAERVDPFAIHRSSVLQQDPSSSN